MKMTTVTKSLSRLVLRASAALPLVLAPAVSVNVLQAAGIDTSFAQAHAAEQETRKVPAMRQNVFKKLGKVQEAADAEDWNGALAALRDMEEGKEDYNAYEVAQMYYFYGYVYYSMERYKSSIASYKQVLAQGVENIPVGTELNSIKTIAQLYFVIENYDQAINYLNKWFARAEKASATDYAMRASIYYQKGDMGNALVDVNKAVSMYENDGKVPKEQWFGLQRYLYYEKNDYKKVAAILEKLVEHYPKGDYYKQLAAMYGELKREKDQLHMMEAAYIAGALQKEKELLNMAYLFMGADMPYKGAKVIDKGIEEDKIPRTSKNLETLAQAYRLAQELKKAIPNLEAAAKMSDDGDIYARLASIYLDLDKNDEAVQMGAAAFKKGSIERPDQLQIVMGMANANLKRYDQALEHLKEAKKDDRSEKFAKQWIAFVKKEKERQEQLAI